MDKKNLAFDKMNFILLGIGMAIIIIGFLLMSGAGSNEHTFDTLKGNLSMLRLVLLRYDGY